MSSSDPRSDAPQAPRSRIVQGWAGFCLALACVWLGGQFLTQGLSDYYLDERPEFAVVWRGDSADALGALARQWVAVRNDAGAARLSQKAVAHSPLDTSAMTAFGFAESRLGDNAAADKIMNVVGSLTWRDPVNQLWLARSSIEAKHYQQAVVHADALMRNFETVPPVVLQLVGALAQEPGAVGALTRQMTAKPLWRGPLIDYLCSDPAATGLPIARKILVGLSATPSPPTQQELSGYLDQLTARKMYAQAVQDWRLFTRRPTANGDYVNNGRFSRPPDGTPFDWSLANGVGWTASIDLPPSGGSSPALRVDYDGVSAGQPLQELVVLAPGSYRLSGHAYVETSGARANLSWALTCADTGKVLARSPTPADRLDQWRDFSSELTVPADGCSAQWLGLAPTPGERPADLAVWYDDIAISPAAQAAAPSRAR